MFQQIKKDWQDFEYKHTSAAIIMLLLTLLFLNTSLSIVVLEWFKNVGLMGGFVAGIMSVSLFTTTPALILLFEISQHVNPLLLTLVATIGSVIGDWLVAILLADEISGEMKPLLRKYHILGFIRQLQKSRARFVVSLLGAILIMTPLPDEFGIALMDIAHMKRRTLLLICFVLNGIGIYTFIMISRAV